MFETLSLITVADLSVRECGPDGVPTICFLHGGGISGWMWCPQVEALQESYHCLRGAEEHSWNLQRPELFNAVARAWLTDQPLPPGLLPLR